MFNALKNQIIRFLIRHTYIDAGVCYEVANKITEDEMVHYYKRKER